MREKGRDLAVDEPPDDVGLPLNGVIDHRGVWIEGRWHNVGDAGEVRMVRGELDGVVQVACHLDVDLVHGSWPVAIEVPIVQEERADDATALRGGHARFKSSVQEGFMSLDGASVALVVLGP